MLTKFKEQWNAECTKLGSFFKKVVSIFMLIAGAALEYSPQLGLLPDGFVPSWLKYVFGVLAAASLLFGGLTKKK